MLVTITWFHLSAQTKSVNRISRQNPNLVSLAVIPSDTDHRITAMDSAHLVLYDPNIKQGKLMLFMVGTFGIATKATGKFIETALEQGYRVINLSYITTPSGVAVCTRINRQNDSECIEKFRIKRIYGDGVMPLMPDEPQDAIINRLTKLLLYLAENDKQGNWGMYLENGAPKWSEIALSGQSQGGGMAAYIAKNTLVHKVITFSGGWDFAEGNQIAKWYYKDSATPPERWYGAYHVEENYAKALLESYQAMRIPDSHIYHFSLSPRKGRKAHSEGVSSDVYKSQWVEMLGTGN